MRATCLLPEVCYFLTTRVTLHVFSPYHLTIALNRMELPDGSPPRGILPVRYVVGRASHSAISAAVACRPMV